MNVIKRRWLVAAILAFALALPTASQAGWSDYVGPSATFYPDALGGPNGGASNWNNWTNNRIYRPIGHPIYLGYQNSSSFHYSTTNWADNPVYFPSFGYNASFCQWEFWNDGSTSLYPVTCQVFI